MRTSDAITNQSVVRSLASDHFRGMYTLYFSTGTASFAPQMILEEADLPHRLVEIDISQGEHRSSDYLAINPAGKVPALRLRDGWILTESSAICLYLADAHQLSDVAPGPHEADRPLFLKSLIYLATSVQDHYKRFYYPERYSTDGSGAPQIKAKAVELLCESWGHVEQHLSENGPFHLGTRPSATDIYLVMLVSWFPDQDDFRLRFPSIVRCFDLVADRPAIRRGLERQHIISVSR